MSYTYDTAYNRLEQMSDGTGATSYGYHPVGVLGAGRLSSVDGPLTDDTLSYVYDELGRVVSRGLAAFAGTTAYDSLGRVSAIGSPAGDFTWGYDGITSRPLNLGSPNGQTTSYAYLGGTEDRRLQQIRHQAPGGPVLSQFEYTYDVVGNIGTWQKQYGTDPATLLDLGYDAVDQLTAATRVSTDPTPLTLKRYAYAYDPAGNRTTEQIDDTAMAGGHNVRNQLETLQPGGALRFQGSLDEEARVEVGGQRAEVRADDTFEGRADVEEGTTQVEVEAQDYAGNVRTSTYEVSQTGATTSYTYDPNGSLTSDGTRTYEWDGANRLVRVSEGSTELASFVYDGQGRRVQKTAGGVTRTYIYDGEGILEERLSSGTTYRYVHGPGIDQPFARVDGTTGTVAAYYLADHLGSIVQETDNAGVVSLTREYDPWGNLIQGSATSGYAYTAREWDPEIGLYYYRARYYDPKIGRFLSEDPAGFISSANFYAYVDGNPVRYIDSYGRVKFEGFSGDEEQQMRDAMRRVEEKLEEQPCCAGSSGPRIVKLMNGAKFRKVKNLRNKTGPLCGNVSLGGWLKRRIDLSDTIFDPTTPCGSQPLECHILHEVTHLQVRNAGEDDAYWNEYACFGCGTGKPPE